MLRLVAVALVFVIAGAFPARAAELVLAWDTDVLWDSNVFRDDTDEESDFQARIGPDLRLRDQKGDLTYDLLYQLRYEAYLRTEGVNDFDHFASARGAWQITPNTRVSVSDYFSDTSSLGSLLEFVGTDPQQQTTVITPQRQRVMLNQATTDLTHRLTPRWNLVTSMSHGLVEYEQRSETDSTSFTGVAQVLYGWSPRLTVGFGAQGQRQDFDPINQLDEGSASTFVQAFGVAEYYFTPTFKISVNAGPAYSIPDTIEQEFQTVDYLTVNNVAVNAATCARVNGRAAFDFTSVGGGCGPAVYRDQVTGEPVFAIGRDSQGDLIFASPSFCEDNPCSIVGVTPGQQSVPLQSARVVPIDGQETEPSLTYFARVRAEKRWRVWRGELGYQRSASSASGVGVSTALDTFSGLIEWTPTRHWLVRLEASYSMQSSFGDQQVPVAFAVEPTDAAPSFDYAFFDGPGGGTAVGDAVASPVSLLTTTSDSAIDIATLRGILLVQRRIGANLTVDGTVTYWRQQNSGDFQTENERDIFTIGVGVIWRFDPIVL